MKTLFLAMTSVLAIFTVTSSPIFAKTEHQKTNNTVNSKKASDQIHPPLINLYSNHSTKSKIIKKISPLTNMVSIFNKGDWIKVGNRENGTVGWIQKSKYKDAIIKYRQALEKRYFPSHVERIYIETTQNTNGKDPKTQIVAYRNGTKLSPEETKKLHLRIKKQEMLREQYMDNIFARMDRFMAFEQHFMRHHFSGPFFSFWDDMAIDWNDDSSRSTNNETKNKSTKH